MSMGEAAEEWEEAPDAVSQELSLRSMGTMLPTAAERTHMNRTGGDTSRSTCSTSRSEYGRRDPSKRVAGALNVDQEEVLIAIMFDDFMATNMKSLDYDHVVRNAITIQCDPDVCKVLGVVPVAVDECWIPADDCTRSRLRPCSLPAVAAHRLLSPDASRPCGAHAVVLASLHCALCVTCACKKRRDHGAIR